MGSASGLFVLRVDRTSHPPKRHELLAAADFIRTRLLARGVVEGGEECARGGTEIS
jgi:hypothetical protein